MTSTVDLRSPITVRPLTAHLGAEISDVKLAEDITDAGTRGTVLGEIPA